MSDINMANEIFWNELCGSGLAKSLGIKEHTLESLRKFDEAYLNFYPYLLKDIKISEMAGKKVLEVGLGYGTLGQKIIEAGAYYTGLDIAEGPVGMMVHRLKINSLPGKVLKSNILQSPLESKSFDYIVSIGCFHHTGNVQQCLDETFRLLKPGGKAFIMLYNRFSLRQWKRWPGKTLRFFLSDLGIAKDNLTTDQDQRKAYDSNSYGEAAPETVFLSIRQLKTMLKNFSNVRFKKENFDENRFIPRKYLLANVAKLVGLDIYIEATK